MSGIEEGTWRETGGLSKDSLERIRTEDAAAISGSGSRTGSELADVLDEGFKSSAQRQSALSSANSVR